MRLIPFLSLSAALAVMMPSVQADTIWAEGVTKKKGWYDACKTKDDSLMCWAAACSNIIAWWEAKADKSLIPANTPVAKNPGKDPATVIFEDIKTHWKDVGRGSNVGWNWYFGGCVLAKMNYEKDFDNPATARTSGQYWKDYVIKAGKTCSEPGSSVYVAEGYAFSQYSSVGADTFCHNIVKMFKQGAGITLTIKPEKSLQFGHAITLWGIDYEGNRVKTIYITDSDNGDNVIQAYDVRYQEKDGVLPGDGKSDEEHYKETKILLTIYKQTYEILHWSALTLPPAKKAVESAEK